MSSSPLDQTGASPPRPPSTGWGLGWLKKHESTVLAIGVGLQVAVLVGMIASRAVPLVTGDTLLLRVVPVDPRDLFRGDYVILGYDFSRIPPEGIQGLPKRPDYGNRRERRGQTVYVSLAAEPDGEHWRAEKFSIHRPSGGKFLRGTITGWNRIEFGIESFYVPEGEGLKYERAIRGRGLSAEVAVISDGTAVLRGLRIE